ncbi:MAG: hypothetical protein H0X38_00715, partial [Planctomycetes bacterium]|nr:hypothetical protein [Planctomycetota bacterium]
IYSSHALVDKVYIYRNPISESEELVSWRWHYDNHPVEVLKAMVYLTAVGEGDGPFEYLRNRATGEAVTMPPLPLARDSRIAPARMAALLASGHEGFKVLGPAGTVVLFDDNVIHRANRAERHHRDVVVLQARPADFRQEHRIDGRFTGGFAHADFNPDPACYLAVTKKRTQSA